MEMTFVDWVIGIALLVTIYAQIRNWDKTGR